MWDCSSHFILTTVKSNAINTADCFTSLMWLGSGARKTFLPLAVQYWNTYRIVPDIRLLFGNNWSLLIFWNCHFVLVTGVFEACGSEYVKQQSTMLLIILWWQDNFTGQQNLCSTVTTVVNCYYNGQD